MIPPAIGEEFLRPHNKSQKVRFSLGIDEVAPVITYMGGFESGKGLPVLMQIIEAVVIKIPEAVFVIAMNRSTDDPALKLFEMELKTCGFSKNVCLIGITDRIADVLAMGDVFVAPYLHTMGVADYPLAIFEAMALGKVAIAFGVGGISEMLNEERGIVVQPGYIESFVEHVVKVIRNKESFTRMGKAASQYVVQNFSPEIVAAKTVDLFTDIVENKPQ
jgi:glycosyltransferase involved in cell wall biosynthesis